MESEIVNEATDGHAGKKKLLMSRRMTGIKPAASLASSGAASSLGQTSLPCLTQQAR